MNRNLMRKKKRKVSSILERNKKPGICSGKADNYDRGNSVVVAGFFFMYSDVAVHGRYFYEKQNARQRTIVGNKKQPAASLCILYMNKAEIL